jgi:rhodanese-related sulfurtransferase
MTMVYRTLKWVVLAVVALTALMVVGGAAIYLNEERSLRAAAEATPQVPGAAAVSAPSREALSASLPRDLNPATVDAIRARSDTAIIDVRSPAEAQAGGVIPGAVVVSLPELPERLEELPVDKTVVFVCNSGRRSAQAAELAAASGRSDVHQMLGGMRAWRRAGREVVPSGSAGGSP